MYVQDIDRMKLLENIHIHERFEISSEINSMLSNVILNTFHFTSIFMFNYRHRRKTALAVKRDANEHRSANKATADKA